MVSVLDSYDDRICIMAARLEEAGGKQVEPDRYSSTQIFQSEIPEIKKVVTAIRSYAAMNNYTTMQRFPVS